MIAEPPSIALHRDPSTVNSVKESDDCGESRDKGYALSSKQYTHLRARSLREENEQVGAGEN